jgi:predicted hotdog family 3-hydroxylacyl-ACP dehydratase
MIPFAIIICLIVECLLLITVVMSLGDSVGNGSYDFSVSAVFHPRVEANFDVLDVGPCRCIGGEK